MRACSRWLPSFKSRGAGTSGGHRLHAGARIGRSSTFTTNQPSVTGARPEPKPSSRASRTGRVWASKPEDSKAGDAVLLLAGRAVHRRPRVAVLPSRRPCAGRRRATARRLPRTADQQRKRAVVRSSLGALGQGVGMDGAKHGAARGVHYGNGDLGLARRVEHDPVDFPVPIGDLYELSFACRLHQLSVPVAVTEPE